MVVSYPNVFLFMAEDTLNKYKFACYIEHGYNKIRIIVLSAYLISKQSSD